ncbi:MAG: hypothetical protein IT436_03665 [Phycisphaerales bacterium]|nr:hypothetical protein [Phycisphaerales bacterium]
MSAIHAVPVVGWSIRPDPADAGVRAGWWRRPPADGWRPARVPGSFHHDLGPDARGVVWYRATLPTPGGRQQKGLERTWLRFESVATDCRAWVNGVEVGRHIGDFIPFEFELTEALRGDRDAELIVRVDQMYAPKPPPGVLVQNGHIGKGFHDVVSLQHGGIWGGVMVRRTNDWAIRPNGLHIVARTDGTVRVRAEFWPGRSEANFTMMLLGAPMGRHRDWSASASIQLAPGQAGTELTLDVPEPELWSPAHPARYSLLAAVEHEGAAPGRERQSDSLSTSFGFRSVETGGPGNRQILLNGRPVLLRGMLHWGHEPEHIAPAPTPAQVRAEFARLKELGFNCVCLCMVYMPEHYYDIADEMGMLIWQEHPVWKSPMGDEHIPEYRRLFAEYFRRDRNHPSVILVSGACEHEKFNLTLAEWWWDAAQRELPLTLKQVQTAFFGWSDLDRTDLYDEHTYENSGRWVHYVRDVRAAMERLPQGPKPFVLGETIISNAWPEVQELGDAARTLSSGPSPWWMTGGLAECSALEAGMRGRYGEAVLPRFRAQARRHNLNLRQFQSEVLRLDPGVGGWVMNHLRDVPICRCGFMDDLGHWRYESHEVRGFLGDAALLLETPGHLRAFTTDESLRGRLHLSNFGPELLELPVALSAVVAGREAPLPGITLTAEVGEIASGPVMLGRFQVDRPTRVEIIASADEGRIENRWSLWALPHFELSGRGVLVADEPPFTAEELALEFEEKCYSSGWGLPVETWSPRPQSPAELLPGAPSRDLATAPGVPGEVIVTHRLGPAALEALESGSRIVLLASRLKDGLAARTTMLWSGVPLVLEDGPLGPGDSEWVVDLLHNDLTRRHQRAIPTGELGLADEVQPIIRFLQTHDSGVPRIFDFAFAARVGPGLLIVSSLDHYEDAGRYWLARLLAWARADGAADSVQANLSAERLRAIVS